ncbi:MAG: hypothetical protein QOC87_854 [Actinomycetota bacterium]|nr:hypothetical protein [Actinomycetota bacterium]
MARSDEPDKRDPLVSAVVLAFNRKEAMKIVLDHLSDLPVDEIVVVDNGTDGTSGELAQLYPDVRVLHSGQNLGIAGRNRGADLCRGRYLLMLDDDSYPLPGAVDRMVEVLESQPRVGVVGGFVRDVDRQGAVIRATELGTFDWFLRGGRSADDTGTIPSFFFPEGAALVRRDAFTEVGGFFEPYFTTLSELDLATRLIAAGWDVRYDPDAPFDHMKAPAGRDTGITLRYRIRNEIWYFWLRYPGWAGAWRTAYFLCFGLVECAYRRALGAWGGGIADAWRQRRRIRGMRRPLPARLVGRAELDRRALHRRLLFGQLHRRTSRGARG